MYTVDEQELNEGDHNKGIIVWCARRRTDHLCSRAFHSSTLA